MKLRILDNSIRLRLSKTEVASASSTGLVRGRVAFPDNHVLEYVFESSPAAVTADASFANNVLTVRVPQSDVNRWAESEEVSIEAAQNLDDGQKLLLLVEKDFACLAPRDGEDESDMFPHPEADNKTC